MSRNSKTFDLVVVGGGITGHSVVLHAIEYGIRPEKIAWIFPKDLPPHSTTSLSQGFLLPGFADLVTRLDNTFGRRQAIEVWKFGHQAFEYGKDFLEKNLRKYRRGEYLRLTRSEMEEKEWICAEQILENTDEKLHRIRKDFLDPYRILRDPLGSIWTPPLEWMSFLRDQFLSKVIRLDGIVDALSVNSEKVSLSLRERHSVLHGEVAVMTCHIQISHLVEKLREVFIPVLEQWQTFELTKSVYGLQPGSYLTLHNGMDRIGFVSDKMVSVVGGRFLRKFAGIGTHEGKVEARILDYTKKQVEKIFQQTVHILNQGIGVSCRPCDELPVVGPLFGEPRFGPFVLNGEPFFRKTSPSKESSAEFECAGDYRMQLTDDHVVLTKTPSAKLGGPQTLWIQSDFQQPHSGHSDFFLRFRFADQFSGSPWTRKFDQAAECSRKIDLPIFSLLSWNPGGNYSKHKDIRKALTLLLPREEFIESGAAKMGDLVSAPLLKAHPGYRRDLVALPYNPEKAGEILDSLGYKRNASRSRWRMDPQTGRPLEIVFGSKVSDIGYLEKILTDSFSAAFIKTRFEFKSDNLNHVDAVITSIKTPWPDSNFIKSFHSGKKFENGLFLWPSKGMDRHLEDFAKSITSNKPSFEPLKKIHQIIFDDAHLSVLIQHQCCLEAGESYGKNLTRVIVRDPDWFLKLIQ